MTRRIRNHLARVDPVMAQLVEAVGPYRFKHQIAVPTFHTLARAIAHQQLNGTAARAIFARFVALFGAVDFPSPQAVIAMPQDSIRAAGFSLAKIAGVKDLAAKVLDGTVPPLQELLTLNDDEIVERLTTVRGIGRWTVEMMLMAQLGRPDVLPVDDFGIRHGFRLAYGLRGMPTARALLAYGERWRPHRTAAAWYLWRAVDLAREGKLPRPAARVRVAQVKRRAHAKVPIKRASKARARK
jgi:DNA-3-methyladenine glycosylase II